MELAAIRQSPRSPELGATLREARQLCDRAQGRFHPPGSEGTWHCNHGPRVVFGGHASHQRVDHIVTLFEGADSVTLRQAATEQYGSPGQEDVIDGFRVWRWRLADRVLLVGGYEHGALIGWSSAAP